MSIAADFPDYVFKVIGLRPWDTGVEVDAVARYVVRNELLSDPTTFKKKWDEVNRYIIGLRIEMGQEIHVHYMGQTADVELETGYFELVEDTSPENGGAALTELFGVSAGHVWKAFVPPTALVPPRRRIYHALSAGPQPATVEWKVKVQLKPVSTVQMIYFVGRYLSIDGVSLSWNFAQYADGVWRIPALRTVQVPDGAGIKARTAVVGLPGRVHYLN